MKQNIDKKHLLAFIMEVFYEDYASGWHVLKNSEILNSNNISQLY